MRKNVPRRMIIFGFDGAGPPFIEKFSKEGKLPNFTRLMGG
jgi:hypothetical protein